MNFEIKMKDFRKMMKDDGTIYVTKFDGSLLNLLNGVGVDCFFWAGPGDFLSLSVLELFSALCCHGYGTKKLSLHHNEYV